MPDKRSIVFVLLLSIAGCLAVVFCAVLPVALQARRETVRRAKTTESLKQIGAALERYRQRTAPPANAIARQAELRFDTYSGYFVSNKFEPKRAASFLVLTDQRQFDNVFGVAMVMGDKSRRLPKGAFASDVVLAVIKRGPAVVDYQVEGVTARDGVVTLRYTAKANPAESASFACPLIVSIPRAKYTVVRFIENGVCAKQSAF
ncbi:MAG: hypothetical protein ABFC96_05230 [Thermoguttaceae bacterium]